MVGRLEVGENGQNSEGVVLRPATEFASLALSFYYVLVGGVSFKRLKKPQKIAEHDTRTYGKLSLFIFLTLYQHLGSKRAKFCVL